MSHSAVASATSKKQGKRTPLAFKTAAQNRGIRLNWTAHVKHLRRGSSVLATVPYRLQMPNPPMPSLSNPPSSVVRSAHTCSQPRVPPRDLGLWRTLKSGPPFSAVRSAQAANF